MWFGSDNPRPAFDVSFFEEVLSVLARVFDLVEIGLSDGEWFVHVGLCFEGELSAGREELDWDVDAMHPSRTFVIESDEGVFCRTWFICFPSCKDD